ncbi:MAG TPA: ShlB/FhaC/HecB family hemolysin secretion/activation protein [Desulfuromonadales bacterium]|nr:ShlB/FhaC/HecB family hemolysin secretion/activation protein [Desulfuromonadales bacterium]
MKKIPFFLSLLSMIVLLSVNVGAEESSTPRFEIKRFLLEGNTLLSSDKVAALLAPGVGKERDFADVQQTIERLEQAYRSSGYTLTAVILPEQELSRGEVRLQVIEPRLKEIKIEGNQHFSNDNVLASLPTLKVGATPLVSAISENLRAANENPFRKLTLQFTALENPEELKAALQVKDQKPWRVALSGDNTGTSQSGYYRAGLSLQHGNLFGLDHIAILQYTTSPDHFDKVKTVSGSYRLPIYRLGDSLDLFGAYSDSDSTLSQQGLDMKINGRGVIGGFRYNLNLPRSGGYEQKLVVGMDYRQYDNTLKDGETDLLPDVVAHPFGLTYSGSWQGDALTFDIYGSVLHNEPWGGQGQRRDFALQPRSPKSNYWIFRYGFNKMLRLPLDFMIRVGGNGQYTPDKLIPGEMLGLGGATTVRGYEEREESWDAGFSGSVETYTPDFAALMGIPHTQFRLLAFFDGGVGYNLRPSGDDPTSNSLKSVGAGFRLGFGEYFSFTLDWGYALDPSLQTRRGGNAIHFKGQLAY